MKIEWYGEKVLSAVQRASDKALESTAIDVHRDAVLNAPVDTGRLRASINYSVSGSGVKGGQSHKDKKPDDDKVYSEPNMAVVGTNVEYALKQEYIRSYLRNAFDKNIKNLDKWYDYYIKKELK